jgi:hypothetical protein
VDWWLQRWGERAEQDAAHSRESAEYLALCCRDVLRAGDDGSFDDDGSWEDDSAFYTPGSSICPAQRSGLRSRSFSPASVVWH